MKNSLLWFVFLRFFVLVLGGCQLNLWAGSSLEMLGGISVEVEKIRELVQYPPDWMQDLVSKFVTKLGPRALSKFFMDKIDATYLSRFIIKGGNVQTHIADTITDADFNKQHRVGPFSDVLQLLVKNNIVNQDCDFFFCPYDFCYGNQDVLIMSICLDFFHMNSQKNVIPIPNFFYFESMTNGMNKKVLDASYAEINKWSYKINKAFWRGRPHDAWNKKGCSSRLQLVKMSLHDDYLDAKFVEQYDFQRFFKEFDNIFQEKDFLFAAELCPPDQVKYKYLVAMDGNSYATSLCWQLFSGSVVIKQETNFPQWFDCILVPYKHYVPIKHDLSDLSEVLRWLISHDEAAKSIAAAARRFALTHLLPEHAIAYFAVLINEIGKKQQTIYSSVP